MGPNAHSFPAVVQLGCGSPYASSSGKVGVDNPPLHVPMMMLAGWPADSLKQAGAVVDIGLDQACLWVPCMLVNPLGCGCPA